MKCKFIDKEGNKCGRPTDSNWELCESHYNRVSDFQRKVIQLFTRPGTEVVYTEYFSPGTPLLLFKTNFGVLSSRILMSCWSPEGHSGSIPHEKVLAFYGLVKSNPKIHRGVFVSATEFSQESLEIAEELPYFDLFTVEDLMSALVNFEDYLQRLSASVNDQMEWERYIPPVCQGEEHRVLRDMEDFLLKWTNEDKRHSVLTILGEEGAGKTTLTSWYVQRLIEKLKSQGRGRIPLSIPLHNVEKIEDLEYFIINTLADLHNLRVESFSVLEKVIENGQVVFVFDGFGEGITDGNLGRQAEVLRKLLKLDLKNNKILITAPTRFFKVQKDTTSLMNIIENHDPEVVEIRPLDKREINRHLEKSFGSNVDPMIQNVIFSAGNVHDLAEKPFWLNVISNIHSRERSRLQPDSTAAELLEYYTNVWLKTEIEVEAVAIPSPAEREVFVEELALEMTRRNALHLSVENFPESLKEKFGSKIENGSFGYFDHLLTKSKFLDKNIQGEFEFSHKILIDYFTAQKIAREIKGEDYNHFEELPLNHTASQFLGEILTQGRLDAMKKSIFEEGSGWAKRNLVAALHFQGENFDGIDLSGALLDGLVLEKPNFRAATLTKASFKGADLRGGLFTRADLRDANFEGACLVGANLNGAKLQGANFQKVEIGNTNLQGVNLWKVRLGEPEAKKKQKFVKLGAIFTPVTQRQES